MGRFINLHILGTQCHLADSSRVVTTKVVATDHVLYRVYVNKG
jgi:hypothetical protein